MRSRPAPPSPGPAERRRQPGAAAAGASGPGQHRGSLPATRPEQPWPPPAPDEVSGAGRAAVGARGKAERGCGPRGVGGGARRGKVARCAGRFGDRRFGEGRCFFLGVSRLGRVKPIAPCPFATCVCGAPAPSFRSLPPSADFFLLLFYFFSLFSFQRASPEPNRGVSRWCGAVCVPPARGWDSGEPSSALPGGGSLLPSAR